MTNEQRYKEIQDQYRWYAKHPRYQTAEAQSFIKQMMVNNDTHMATGEGCLVSGMMAFIPEVAEA